MSFEDKINGIIGLPYDKFTNHCWSLVEFLIPMAPTVKGTAKSLATSVSNFKRELQKHNLNEIDEGHFKNKDIIIMGRNGIMFHAGVFFEDGIIHASENGVVYQPLSVIKIHYNSIQGLRV